MSWISQFDIIFLSETHFTKGQIFELKNYKSYHNPFSDVNDIKARWGISCFISLTILPNVLHVDRSFDNHILITLKGGHRIFGSYIPPAESIYYEDEYFYAIPGFLSPIDGDRIFIGGGDLNSRVGNCLQTFGNIDASYRTNPDTFVNSHGRLLKNICKSHNCLILNNLNHNRKIFDGNFTFEKAGNKSQNDICVTNITGLKGLSSFNIHDISFNFSDHKPISITLKIPCASGIPSKVITEDLLSNSWDSVPKRQQKINPDNVNWNSYKIMTTLKLNDLTTEIDKTTARDQNFMNNITEKIENALYNTAKLFEATYHEPDTVRSFSTEHRSVDEISADIILNENAKWSNILNSTDPAELWSEIAWKGPKNDLGVCTPTAKDFGNYFTKKSTIPEEEAFTLEHSEFVNCPVLDGDITIDEIERSEKRLKKKKSSSDGWTPRMIRDISTMLYPILLIIFNMILRLGLYPAKWRNTVVSTLFKNKGATWLPKSYRPISLVQLFSKMFDFILLDRFKKWFKPHDCQSAYQHGKSCADHVFLVRALINHCLTNKEKLFVICIDFEGAFDKISRQTLFRKLHIFGAGTVFLSCLMAIYSLTSCTIYQKDNSFTYILLAGIKQGLPLSPWLFLFYINDIFALFDSIYGWESILETVHLLIHADDTTILANSRQQADSKIKTLLSYCSKNHISLQLNKCEFIVINGDENDKRDFVLPYGVVKHVDYVTLLGSQLAESGNLEDDLNYHMKNRYQAVSKFYNFIRTNKLAPSSVKLKVLNACVVTALLHNCETFGNKLPRDLESLYHTLIKTCLNVRRNTPNDLVIIESGMLNIRAMVQSRQYNFYLKFISKLEPNSARKIVFSYLRGSRNKYIEHYSNLLHAYESTNDIKLHHKNATKEKIRQLATNVDDKHYKYKIYMLFNPNLEASDLSKSYSYAFTRLKLSSHSMPIEIGRWNGTTRNLRTCNNCQVLGDEKHYIYDCPTINRVGLDDMPPLDKLSSYEKLPTLIKYLKDYL